MRRRIDIEQIAWVTLGVVIALVLGFVFNLHNRLPAGTFFVVLIAFGAAALIVGVIRRILGSGKAGLRDER